MNEPADRPPAVTPPPLNIVNAPVPDVLNTFCPAVPVLSKKLTTLAAVAVASITLAPAVNVLTAVVDNAAVEPTPDKLNADGAAVQWVMPKFDGALKNAVIADAVEPVCADTATKPAFESADRVAEVTPVIGWAPYNDIDILLPPALPAATAAALMLMRFPTTYSPAETVLVPALPELNPIV